MNAEKKPINTSLMLDLCCDRRWVELKENIKNKIAAIATDQIGKDTEDVWQNTWEFYAYMQWTGHHFYTGLIESDIIQPFCYNTAHSLDEFESEILFAWLWDEYLENYEPAHRYVWYYDHTERCNAINMLLYDEMCCKEANIDGAEIEERGFFAD